MTANSDSDYNLIEKGESDDKFRHYIQGILREYNEAVSSVSGPEAKRFSIRITDKTGNVVGGAIGLMYWGWLVIDVLALEEGVRGRGLGKRLMNALEEKGRAAGCTRVHTTAYDFQALGFYQKLGYWIVGQLEDYPDGYTLYWIRKEL